MNAARPDALFWQTAHADVHAEPEARDNPRERDCPHPPCHAKAGHPCTTLGGRRQLRGYHDSRKAPTS